MVLKTTNAENAANDSRWSIIMNEKESIDKRWEWTCKIASTKLNT